MDVMTSPRIDTSTSFVKEADANLLAVEFSEVDFEVNRIFVVTREGDKRTRGNHVAGGFQKLVLLAGEVDVHLKKTSGEIEDFHFTEIGSSIEIEPTDYVTYELLEVGSQILVLANQSYAQAVKSRTSSK
jgi:hypothetical protein